MSRLWGLLVCAFLLGCPPDGDPSRVRCADDLHCPETWHCDLEAERCAPGADDDDASPDDDDATLDDDDATPDDDDTTPDDDDTTPDDDDVTPDDDDSAPTDDDDVTPDDDDTTPDDDDVTPDDDDSAPDDDDVTPDDDDSAPDDDDVTPDDDDVSPDDDDVTPDDDDSAPTDDDDVTPDDDDDSAPTDDDDDSSSIDDDDASPACIDSDGDGDGSTDCDGDCDDNDAAIGHLDCAPTISSGSVLGSLTGQALGTEATYLGDLDGDGIDELLVSAPGTDSQAGAAYILELPLSEGQTAADATDSYTGGPGGEAAGTSIALLEDTDGDGSSELAFGLPGHDVLSDTGAGAVYVLLGPPSGDVSFSSGPFDSVLHADGLNAGVGTSVASAGDTNDDGNGDLIFGGPHLPGLAGIDSGGAFLVRGPLPTGVHDLVSSPRPDDARFQGEGGGDLAGITVAGACDVNGDGFDDVLIGAPGFDKPGPGVEQGRVYVVFGPVSGLMQLGDVDFLGAGITLDGTSSGDDVGEGLACAGDLDSDGFDDLLITAGGRYSNAGSVYLYRGRSAPLSGTLENLAVARFDGATGDRLGVAKGLAAVGDQDDDGVPDIALGGRAHGSHNTGVVYLISGADLLSGGNLSPADAWTTLFGSADLQSRLGLFVSSLPDQDGDGKIDLLLSGSQEQSDTGALYVVPSSAL